MNLPFKNMYDTFKDEIWKELGPLDPDWFEVLTAQTFTNEGNVSDQDDLCANQEGNFKAPLDKTAGDSQLLSTPKVFRHSRVVSPETEDEQSFTVERDKETLPWTETQSPYLFRLSKDGVPGAKYGDLLHTPQKSPVSYKHISESLGAQIHPDMSWTSSLNTPPAIASTLILTKPNESPCPVSVPADKNVVFVRKLFPSLSNASRVEVVSSQNNGMPTVHQGVVSPVAGQNPESLDSPQSSLSQSDCVWRQRLPDAIEDDEIRGTVASVLDGAEDVLSIFFTNSSSALRKVKTDRIKRKQIIPTKERGCSSTDISATNSATSSKQRTADQEPDRVPSPPPVKTGDTEITQWSPLNLSEIPTCIVETPCHDSPATQVENSILTAQLRSDLDSGKVLEPPMKITHSGFTKKKRKFVYTVGSSKLQVQGEDTQSHKMDSPGIPNFEQDVNVKQFVKTPDEGEFCSIRKYEMKKQGKPAEEILSPSVQAKVQDLDISQLSRDFAQDFSQMPDPNKLGKVAKDTLRNSFSPSACLSAMKRANQKARQENLHHDCDGVNNRRSVSSTDQNNLINEGTISDSGFQSAVADMTHVTASSFVLPCSEYSGQIQQRTSFKTDIHTTTPSTCTNKGNGKAHLDDIFHEAETDTKLSSAIKESQTLDAGRGSKLCMQSASIQLPSSAKGTGDTNCIPLNDQVHGSLPEKTTVSLPSVHASGFKTASNKGICISSANLERAKCLFEETEGEISFCDQPMKCARGAKGELSMSRGAVKLNSNQPLSSSEKIVENSCQLTASQKADVTELCTLLEEADSQFEFTQFKTTKLKQLSQDNSTSPQRVNKELDPDFLMGIDFDDSFNSDPENHLALTVMHDKMTVVTGIRDEDATKRFKNSKMVLNKCQSGFQMASGKEMSVSAKAMQEADAFFKDCDVIDTKKSDESLSPTVSHKKNLQKFKNIQAMKAKFSEDPINEFENVNAGPAAHHTEVGHNVEIHNIGFKNTVASGNAASFHGNLSSTAKALPSLSCTTSENLNDICTLMDTNKQLKQKDALRASHLANQIQVPPPKNCGFQTASGRGFTISSAALKKAKSLLSEYDEIDDRICVKPTHSKMPVPGPPPRNCGFLAASGKPVAFSSEALQKAKALFSDISFSTEIAAVSHSRNSDKKQDNAGNMEKIHCGFTTAGGAKVQVSQKNLLKAKNLLKDFDDGSISAKAVQEADALLKDCDIMDGKDGMSLKHRKSVAPVSGSSSEKKNISERPGHGHAEFENVTVGPIVNHEKMLHSDDMEIRNRVHKNTLDSANSSNGNQSLRAKPSLLCMSKNIGCSSISELSNGVGFCTASGKKVSVSDDAMTKAKSLLNDNATLEDSNKQLKQKLDPLPPQNGGFQTANGKGITISSAALKKAKTLLSEREEVEDKICVKPTHSNMPVPGPPPRNCGFLAASGKPVAFSSEALQKAKALFSNISFGTDIAAVSHTRNSEHKDAQKDNEKIHCGFTTTDKNLLKAKNPLKDFADGKSQYSNSSSTSPYDTNKSDLSKVKNVKRTSDPNLTTASYKVTTTKESAPLVVTSLTSSQATDHENETLQKPTDSFKFKEGKITPSGVGNLHDSLREEMSSVLDFEINHTGSSEQCNVRKMEESSSLHFQSLNLSGYTETQQKFIEQEALDCTKALLEDENLAGLRLSMDLQNMPLHDNPKSSDRSEEQKGKGKRLVEDPDMTGQPPLKRQLLEEFDRTVDGPEGSTLHPEKSSPSGVMKDRRVFRYNASLHPNITRPHRNGKNYVETRLQKTTPTQHSTPGDNREAHSKMPMFVPPFLKNAKSERGENTMLKDNIRTPSAFVPPFKKQRTFVQESSSKPQEEEVKINHLFVTTFKSNAYIPPTKKSQCTTDVTGNKSKENIQTVADTTNDNLMINQNLPVGCGSEDSAAEASCVKDRSQDVFQNLHNVELARDMQDMRIRKKKRQTIRPLPGSLFLTRTSGVSRIPLKAAMNGKPPARYTQKQLYSHGVHRHVYEITSENAESFRFNLQQFVKQEAFMEGGGVQLADGGWLIPSNNGTAGKEEFYRSLCDTPGVDPKLISEEWVHNHYRWIVWKQASMERSFPETMGSLCLTPEQVLLQLKYRYDVEVDHSRRPALRKIMEKDDTAAKTLVLCVCGVVSRGHSPKRPSDIKTPGTDANVGNPSAVVWLTDGWYAIKAQLDEPLTAMLHKGRLAIGGKLIIHGAQLVGSQDACSPLEAPESLMLKICANSSRPTRWDSKLGFHKDPRPFLLPVSCLYSNGGPVGCVDIIILRSYPIQWMERKPDGGVVFRSVRAEEKEARRYNSHKQKAMEILFAKIQDEFEKEEKGNNKPQRRRRTSRQDVASLQDGEELYEAVGDDPAYLEAHLSEQQMETLRAYRSSVMEKKQAELQDRYRRALENAEDREGSCPKRDVTPVWRLCIADFMEQPGIVYQMNLWRPPSDLQSLLKEGCRYKVYNLTTSDAKKYGGSTTVQLTGTKKTQFQDLQASREWLSARFQPRVSTLFVDLQNPEFQPLCGEVDLSGYVICIVDGQGLSPAFYLADGKLNFVKVRCFSSLAQSGLEDVIKPGVMLALSNLQLRGQSTSPTPVVYAGDLTVFSTNPKEVHLQESLSQLRKLVQSQENFFLTAEEMLSHLIKSDGQSSISSPALQTRTPASTRDRRQDTKTSVTSQQPARSLESHTPVSRNPIAANCSTEKDPSSLKRRRALDYLSRIPSSPPLSHLSSVASPCLNKTFIPPRRSETPSTLKTVQTPAHKPVSSPVEDEWVNDEELAMIDTQALLVGDVM